MSAGISESASDVVILGGGIIGLGIAWQLARRGAQVTVLERAAPGSGASWAAAGMLAPYTEHLEDAVLRELAVESLRAYPAFAEELRRASGIDVRLRLNGILEVAYDASHARRLRARAALLGDAEARLLTAAELAATEGALAGGAHCAVLGAAEGQVDNRRLGRALTEAALVAGARIRRDCVVTALECSPRRVTGVRTNTGFFAARSVVNALGAWAGELSGVPQRFVVPVRPIKGQILALAMPRGYVGRVVWASGVYLVPRDDGRLIVGATVEERGFDRRLTAGGMHGLLHGVLAALPGASEFSVSETWTGLRPATLDGRPYLGETGLEGYVVASGHYRNGVLLAPVTASRIADGLAGARAWDEAFSPQRGAAVLLSK